jgi:glutamate--cysteine ligase
MELEGQLELLESYFRNGEQEEETIGIEVEHLIIQQEDLTAVNYDSCGGIESILEEFNHDQWQQHKEGDHLLNLSSELSDITIEPGGQLEVGILPQYRLEELEKIYFDFLNELVPILEEKDYLLLALGYQPVSKIEDISWLPKERYKIMADYLGQQGQYAHNMMKGTAAFQLALDYKSEADFVRKFRVAMVLSPVLSIIFDNGPFFEGDIFSEQAVRNLIWSNTDDNRTGIIEEVFASDFGYRKYAEYILSREPILLHSEDDYFSTGKKTGAEIFQDHKLGHQELEHILTMVFPDVRAKQFIEIRMTDSIPPSYFLAVMAFWKGIFYDDSALDKATEFIDQFNVSDILRAKEDIITDGIQAKLGDYKVLEVFNKFLSWSKAGLTAEEIDYLNVVDEIVESKSTLAQQLKNRLEDIDKQELITDYSLNSLLEEEV